MFGCIPPDIKDINKRNDRAMEVKYKCDLLCNHRESARTRQFANYAKSLDVGEFRETERIQDRWETCWRHRTYTFACIGVFRYKSSGITRGRRIDLWIP